MRERDDEPEWMTPEVSVSVRTFGYWFADDMDREAWEEGREEEWVSISAADFGVIALERSPV